MTKVTTSRSASSARLVLHDVHHVGHGVAEPDVVGPSGRQGGRSAASDQRSTGSESMSRNFVTERKAGATASGTRATPSTPCCSRGAPRPASGSACRPTRSTPASSPAAAGPDRSSPSETFGTVTTGSAPALLAYGKLNSESLTKARLEKCKENEMNTSGKFEKKSGKHRQAKTLPFSR